MNNMQRSMVQKKTGIILLPSYLDARIVPDDIEIKLDKTIKVPLDKNGNELMKGDYILWQMKL